MPNLAALQFDATTLFAPSMTQRAWLQANGIKPAQLWAGMTVSTLIKLERETVTVPEQIERRWQTAGVPKLGIGRVLQDAAEAPNLLDGDRPAILAGTVREPRQIAPRAARGMSNHAGGTGIETGIPNFVPAVQAERWVWATRVNVKSGDVHK